MARLAGGAGAASADRGCAGGAGLGAAGGSAATGGAAAIGAAGGRGEGAGSGWDFSGRGSRAGAASAPALAGLRKGDLATVTGRLIYEVSTKTGKGYFTLLANKVELTPIIQPLAVSEAECPY